MSALPDGLQGDGTRSSTSQAGPAAARVVFLGGLGRSGSTLLERMLGELPGVTCLGEVVHLWQRALRSDERCGCGAPFSGCPFWQEVGRRAFGGWDRLDAEEVLALKHRVDRTRHVPRLGLPRLRRAVRRDLAAYVALYERVYAAAAEATGAEVLVDSSKHASLAYCLRWSRRVDLRVLHVVRDSPAVAQSWAKEVRRPEVTHGGDELMPRYGLLRVAARWTVDNLMFDVLSLLGTRTHVIRYEDLVDDPWRTLSAAARHADLPHAHRDLGFIGDSGVHLRRTHTVAGNPMRFEVGALVLRRDEVRRDLLPAVPQWLVGALTAPVRTRFGYPRQPAAAARQELSS